MACAGSLNHGFGSKGFESHQWVSELYALVQLVFDLVKSTNLGTCRNISYKPKFVFPSLDFNLKFKATNNRIIMLKTATR